MVDLDSNDFPNQASSNKQGKSVLDKILDKTLQKITESIGEIQPYYEKVMVTTYTNLLADLSWKNMKHSMNSQNISTRI
jgi:hypothetical protein